MKIVIEYLEALATGDISIRKLKVMDTNESNRLDSLSDLLQSPTNPFPRSPGTSEGEIFRGDVND